MKKIGFLGGTFNPIHNGHLKLAESAYRHLGLNKVLIMPSGVSYLKIDENVLSKQIRSEMVKLAIENYPYFEFSDIEIKKEGNTYTYETLEDLKSLYNDSEIYFIIGADSLFNLETWKNPEKIFSNCIITVMVRDNANIYEIKDKCEYLKEKYNASFEILDADKVDISSTNIRKQIKEGIYNTESNMIPKKVYDYIIKNNLYK